jgi:hypothetical protein
VESEDGGAFNLTYTFDPEEIKPEFQKVTASNPMLHHILSDVGLTKYGMSFHQYEGQEFLVQVLHTAIDEVKNYLHANVSIDPTVEMEDFFTATAEIDGDKIYYSITPSPVIKQHVKDDANTEAA